MKFEPDDDAYQVCEAMRRQTAIHGFYASVMIAALGKDEVSFVIGGALLVLCALAFIIYSDRR
jgi:hypothetical protein